MKPAWDQLGDEYESSSSVVIGDADCTVHQDLCSEHGVRGYPTIKYWKDGDVHDYQGGRDFNSLKSFVSDTLEVKCQVDDQEQCSEKEAKFIAKMQAKAPADVEKQLARLTKMQGDKMKPELKQWVVQRINILRQLGDGDAEL